jgi:hypothetical protein
MRGLDEDRPEQRGGLVAEGELGGEQRVAESKISGPRSSRRTPRSDSTAIADRAALRTLRGDAGGFGDHAWEAQATRGSSAGTT